MRNRLKSFKKVERCRLYCQNKEEFYVLVEFWFRKNILGRGKDESKGIDM